MALLLPIPILINSWLSADAERTAAVPSAAAICIALREFKDEVARGALTLSRHADAAAIVPLTNYIFQSIPGFGGFAHRVAFTREAFAESLRPIAFHLKVQEPPAGTFRVDPQLGFSSAQWAMIQPGL